jgi:hypothetical protein
MKLNLVNTQNTLFMVKPFQFRVKKVSIAVEALGVKFISGKNGLVRCFAQKTLPVHPQECPVALGDAARACCNTVPGGGAIKLRALAWMGIAFF